MHNLRVIFFFFATILYVTSIHVDESGYGYKNKPVNHHNHHHRIIRKTRRSTDDATTNVKLPRHILRKFDEWSKSPANFTVIYHSIPVTVKHIKDDIFQLDAPYRKTKSTIINIRLWMEFPYIRRSNELKSNQFLIDIIPVIGSRDMTGYDDDCSVMSIVANPHFPDDILEIKFDITYLYQACQAKDDSPSLKYKIRFYPLYKTTEVNLARDEVDMFFIFKENDDVVDIMHFLPNSQHIEPLHYEKVIQRFPQLRSFPSRRSYPRSCSLRDFTFSFEVSGWKNYVVAPKKYKSNKCHGKCAFPLAEHLNFTNYAVVKAIGSMIYKEMKNPSCIAQSLAPLTMMVCDEYNKITLKAQKDMIATSCKCA